MDRKNILLIGFMGTGKSTVSSRLKKRLDMKEVDTDALIVEREGMSISDIFAQKGEEAFRNMETALLKELESETFLKIIRGESELSSFDDFVKEWQEEGGNEIIQEMIQERKSLSSQENQKTEEKAEQKAE